MDRDIVKDKVGKRVKSDSQWIRPKADDIQDVEEEQILSCKPVGEWKLTEENIIFELENNAEIHSSYAH